MRVGFIGNFNVSFTTENERKWSLEKLGHEVIAYQENKTTAEQLLRDMPTLDMLIYSHTHDPAYVIKDLREVFARYKDNSVPTVSIHLDRWAWLKRVEDVGQEATWFTEYIFMADASPEAVELYNNLGLNWHYLAPGVVERECYIAPPDHVRFPHEIVFTGSRGYHPEYPFRPQLVDWLHSTYGSRFAHYGNDGRRVVRMGELNTLVSTAKIVVGDSCFGGRPYYVSDRYFETRGRGGFLAHPHQEGIDTNGVANYEHGNFASLKEVIDYYLAHDDERETMRREGFEYVKNHGTYTHRMQEVIDVVFGNRNQESLEEI